MRTLTEGEAIKIVAAWEAEDFSTRFISLNRGHWEQLVPIIAEAQAVLTLKEVGERLLLRATHQHGYPVEIYRHEVDALLRGEMP